MQKAATETSTIEARAFCRLVAFYYDLDYLYGGNDCKMIRTLYCTKHTVPFEVLAGYLGTSVSRLESKRKDYQKMFLHHCELLSNLQTDAA